MVKELISKQLVRYLEHRGVEHVFGLCGHTNIAVLAAMERQPAQVRQHAPRAGRRAHRRRLCACQQDDRGRAVAPRPGPDERVDRRRERRARLDPDGRDRRRHAEPLLRQASAPGSEPARRRGAVEIYRPFVKRVWRVERPDLFPEIIDKAFQLAETGRPGPVLVSVPMDIFSMEIDTALFERLRASHEDAAQAVDRRGRRPRQIVRTLAEAPSPVIQAGGGVILADAAAELRAFVDHMGIPVAHSLMGKGVLPDDHPLTLGMTGFWGTKFVNDKCRDADWVFGLGTRFAEADCSSWEPEFTFSFPPSKLIHIDIDPSEIGRNFPVEIGVVADLKQALTVLNRVARRLFPQAATTALIDEIAAYRARFRRTATRPHVRSDAFPMRPERILAAVRAVLPRDAIITTDVGWNKNGVGQQFPIYTPGSILTPGGYATMGFGAPAAIGAKMACPDRVVVALVGDGGFGQNPAMLATAAEQDVGGDLGRHEQQRLRHDRRPARWRTTAPRSACVFRRNGEPYTSISRRSRRAYGVDGVQIESAAEFKPALERAVASGKPCVIDVAMMNEPVPTAGHWNIMDIYSPRPQGLARRDRLTAQRRIARRRPPDDHLPAHQPVAARSAPRDRRRDGSACGRGRMGFARRARRFDARCAAIGRVRSGCGGVRRPHRTVRTRAPNRAAAVRAPSTAPAVNESSAVPPAPPFQYVGHWKVHGATTVVLSERGRNLLVRVPGAFDDRYHVLAVDEHRLVMKYLPLGIVQTLALSPGAPWTVRPPAQSASPTEATDAPVEVPAPEASNRSTSVRMKAGDVESSMEAPGLPVAPAQPLYGAMASPAASNDAEPEN